MFQHAGHKKRPSSRGTPRVPSGSRTLLACAKCKEKKLKVGIYKIKTVKWDLPSNLIIKCDNRVSGCSSCLRAGSGQYIYCCMAYFLVHDVNLTINDSLFGGRPSNEDISAAKLH